MPSIYPFLCLDIRPLPPCPPKYSNYEDLEADGKADKEEFLQEDSFLNNWKYARKTHKAVGAKYEMIDRCIYEKPRSHITYKICPYCPNSKGYCTSHETTSK